MEISYSEFQDIWAECNVDGTCSANLPQIYSKFKHLKSEVVREAVLKLKTNMVEKNEIQTYAVIKLKPKSYFQHLENDNSFMKLPSFDISGSVIIANYDRETQFVGEDGTTLIADKRKTQITKENFDHKAVEAITNFLDDPFTSELIIDTVLKVSGISLLKATTASRLINPAFVEYLSKQLSCELKDELVVVPFSDDIIYATKSSSFLGCCYLGDVCDISDPLRKSDTYITSIPYCIHEIVDFGTYQLVKWNYYPMYGVDAFQPRLISADGKLRFSVPLSEIAADDVVRRYQGGEHPTVMPIQIRDSATKVTGNCQYCLQFTIRLCIYFQFYFVGYFFLVIYLLIF